MPEETRPPEESGNGPSEDAPRPPVSDEIDWRARALDAESRLAALEREATDLRAQLASTQSALASEKQSREIDRALTNAGAIDPEVASLMLTSMLASQPQAPESPPDIASLIQTLRARRPFLFESALPARPAPSAMSPVITTSPSDSLTDLATQARARGDRRSLLTYLRARAGRA